MSKTKVMNMTAWRNVLIGEWGRLYEQPEIDQKCMTWGCMGDEECGWIQEYRGLRK